MKTFHLHTVLLWVVDPLVEPLSLAAKMHSLHWIKTMIDTGNKKRRSLRTRSDDTECTIRKSPEVTSPAAHTSLCTKCGACCQGLFIFVTPQDLQLEPLLSKVVSRLKNRPEEQPYFGEYSNRYLLSAGWAIPCPMLDSDGLCSIYPTRPQACRQWQADTPQCRQLRRKLKAIHSYNR